MTEITMCNCFITGLLIKKEKDDSTVITDLRAIYLKLDEMGPHFVHMEAARFIWYLLQ